MFSITPEGFNRKTFVELFSEASSRAYNLFGPDIQLSEDAFFGMLLQLYIYFQDESWQILEQLYNSAYIDTATGVNLDALVKFINIKRSPPIFATGLVTFIGSNGVVIPVNTIVASDDLQYKVTEEKTILTGSIDVPIKAIKIGEHSNTPANTITTLVNPIIGVTSINNAVSILNGKDQESDFALRERYYNSLQIGGKSTLDAIRSSVLQVVGVTTVFVLENDTNIIDGSGRPPKSFEVVVNGGSDIDVAKAILDAKGAGIATFGSVSVTVQDISGTNRIINFNRPIQIAIHCNCNIIRSVNYPPLGDTIARDLIVNFINELQVGEDVIITQLITKVFSKLIGVSDIIIELSTDGINYSAININVNSNEKAITENNQVVVTSV